MEDFITKKIEELGIVELSKLILFVGIIGLIITVGLLILNFKSAESKLNHVKNLPDPKIQESELLNELSKDLEKEFEKIGR